ncbi:hypothetical protein [Burkholderia vietnamiensis]|uniref:Uncharacterized protein n=1 Tax=Burkholderia vietnamiensis TaxID=60552 RepID=A0ABS1AYN9_BURVI|nr:hypothetical protein [Burkholderia vietnamiensis]AOK43096.1 hypothetical protein WL96_18425 [Burkholderia vietnamiensis]KVF13566.1 hypothetical protein WJ05_09060 [Burkholderia vietnamiensis]KVF92275.1 hypothetical protein WJ21_28905 [Burkholderia vietnamiensis]MBJ9688646.1 hypothetical protein [Burkholderia vietnamiensis]MBR8188207.1 hypothetical protein [Burkholderia vietnamiensis]
MSRPGLRRRYRGFAAGVDVGVDVDGGRVRSRQNAAGDIQADEWRVLDHARRARSRDPLANRSVGRIGRRRIRPESDRVK